MEQGSTARKATELLRQPPERSKMCSMAVTLPFATSFESSDDQVLVARILSLGTQLA